MFDRLSVDVEDAAMAFAQSVRLMLRLCRSRPQIPRCSSGRGCTTWKSEGRVAPRLLRDIRAGVASGRFLKAEPRLARAAVSGAVLATLQMSLTNPELVDDAAGDQLVEQLLRMLGVTATAGTPPACRSRTCSRRRLGSQSPTGDRPYRSKNASSRARAGGEGDFRVRHCSADNSRITLSTYRLARGRRVHSSAVSSRQAARYSSEIRCRSATKPGSVPISEIS